jgi:CMP-2-keto-3-deoxyoctulosonic acid synthetase
MSTRRILALNDVINRKPISIKKADKKVSEYYGSDVFGLDAMREFLSEEAFNSIQNSMHQGTIVERKMADQMIKCKSHDILFDKGEVKIVLNHQQEALLFSRNVIPHIKGKKESEWHKRCFSGFIGFS